MIFVTVGTSHYGFPRLVRRMDEIAPLLPEPVEIQLGCTDYRPRNAAWTAFLPVGEMLGKMAAARLIIGHASAGPILHARKFKVPLILVPRRPEFQEHVDGHQVETGKAVEGLPMVEVVWDMDALPEIVRSVLGNPGRLRESRRPTEQTGRLIQAIREFVDGADAAARKA